MSHTWSLIRNWVQIAKKHVDLIPPKSNFLLLVLRPVFIGVRPCRHTHARRRTHIHKCHKTKVTCASVPWLYALTCTIALQFRQCKRGLSHLFNNFIAGKLPATGSNKWAQTPAVQASHRMSQTKRIERKPQHETFAVRMSPLLSVRHIQGHFCCPPHLRLTLCSSTHVPTPQVGLITPSVSLGQCNKTTVCVCVWFGRFLCGEDNKEYVHDGGNGDGDRVVCVVTVTINCKCAFFFLPLSATTSINVWETQSAVGLGGGGIISWVFTLFVRPRRPRRSPNKWQKNIVC